MSVVAEMPNLELDFVLESGVEPAQVLLRASLLQDEKQRAAAAGMSALAVGGAPGNAGTEAAAEVRDEPAMRALEEGAVSIVTKPRIAVREFLYESAVTLVDAVRAAAQAKLPLRRPRAVPSVPVPPPGPKLSADAMLPKRKGGRPPAGADRVIAIGASAGGTEALREVLAQYPEDAPGTVIVQHMPETFTRAFAARLDGLCAVQVREAADGDQVVVGRVLIAPGNRHMMLRGNGGRYSVELADGPLVSRHRPSVDVLFRSVAQVAGARGVGAILTGMGDDGARGLLEMRQAGARTIAQDEASCIVFGMPKEAIARGAAQFVVPLGGVAAAILSGNLPTTGVGKAESPDRGP